MTAHKLAGIPSPHILKFQLDCGLSKSTLRLLLCHPGCLACHTAATLCHAALTQQALHGHALAAQRWQQPEVCSSACGTTSRLHDVHDIVPCRASRLALAAAAAGRAALTQQALRSQAAAAPTCEQAAACVGLAQQVAQLHAGRQLCRAEPAEELPEDHRAALRTITPKV